MTARWSVLRTVLSRIVLGVLVCTLALIVAFMGLIVAGATGLSFDPHGYGIVAGVFLTAILTPVALALWLLYLLLRR